MNSEPPALDDDAMLAGFLADRDVPCPVCAYNLRGLGAGVCPECAARLHLQVGSVNLRLGPWVFGVISFALALGFDGVVSLTGVAALVVHPPPSLGTAWPVIRTLGVLLVLGAVCTIGLAVMIRQRPAWCRMRNQWAAAAAIFIITGVVHGIVGLMLIRSL